MIKSQSGLGKGGQRVWRKPLQEDRSTAQDKPGDFLTVQFDSRGVSLSGFGLDLSDFVETMLHRSYQRQTSSMKCW